MKTIANGIDFLNKAVIIQWNIRKKDLQLFATKVTEKIPDFCNAKERYQWFLGKKNTKSVKQWKIFAQSPKRFENPNIVHIKTVTIKDPKTSHE